MINFKGAIFDLDGTLLDTMPAWDNLGINFLKRYKIVPPKNLKNELITLNFLQTGEYLKKKFNLPQTAQEINKEILSMIKQQYYFHAHLKPFVKPYLKKLKKANIKICIATATDYKLAQAALKRLEIADYFDFIITCDQIGKGKEYPDIYLYAAKKLCLPISEIAVFEDSLHAIITAKKAGFQVIGVYDESSKEDKEKIIKIADGFINSYTDGGFTYEKGVNDSRL